MRAVIALATLVLAAAPLAAQQRTPAPPPQQAPAPAPPPAPVEPPYQQKMERLAEILGALDHLRPLCVAAERDVWRVEMAALIEAEQPDQGRRDRLVAAFNRGQSAFRETYRACTPSAEVAAERYRQEAIALARELATRYTD